MYLRMVALSRDIGYTAFLCEGPFRQWLIQETSMPCIVVFPKPVIDSLADILFVDDRITLP